MTSLELYAKDTAERVFELPNEIEEGVVYALAYDSSELKVQPNTSTARKYTKLPIYDGIIFFENFYDIVDYMIDIRQLFTAVFCNSPYKRDGVSFNEHTKGYEVLVITMKHNDIVSPFRKVTVTSVTGTAGGFDTIIDSIQSEYFKHLKEKYYNSTAGFKVGYNALWIDHKMFANKEYLYQSKIVTVQSGAEYYDNAPPCFKPDLPPERVEAIIDEYSKKDHVISLHELVKNNTLYLTNAHLGKGDYACFNDPIALYMQVQEFLDLVIQNGGTGVCYIYEVMVRFKDDNHLAVDDFIVHKGTRRTILKCDVFTPDVLSKIDSIIYRKKADEEYYKQRVKAAIEWKKEMRKRSGKPPRRMADPPLYSKASVVDTRCAMSLLSDAYSRTWVKELKLHLDSMGSAIIGVPGYLDYDDGYYD